MEDVTMVSCEVCGHEVLVSRQALRSPERLEQELPLGWDVEWQYDEDVEDYVRVGRCPSHKG